MNTLELVSEPVRLRILRHLSDGAEASLSELANAVGVHVNTLRAHLRVLEEGGLVVRRSEPSGTRGRPRVRVRLAEGSVLPGADLRRLGQLLAEVVVGAGVGERDLRRIGAAYGRSEASGQAQADPRRILARVLEGLGFQADVGRDGLRLRACPCPLISPARPTLVCSLAAGAIDGVLRSHASPYRVGRRAHDPSARSCWVGLRSKQRPQAHPGKEEPTRR